MYSWFKDENRKEGESTLALIWAVFPIVMASFLWANMVSFGPPHKTKMYACFAYFIEFKG